MDHVWGVHIGGIHAVLKDFKQISRRRITIIFLPKHENFLSKVSCKTFICVISWDFGQNKNSKPSVVCWQCGLCWGEDYPGKKEVEVDNKNCATLNCVLYVM